MRLAIYGEIEGERYRIGKIETVPGYEEQFTYDEEFVTRFPKAPLSVSLPIQIEAFPARQTRAYFRNLLPEGMALAAVAKTLEVKSSSYLKILHALGNECIGAVIVEAEDFEGEEQKYGYEPIPREALGEIFQQGAEGIARLQEDVKLSLAGAQSKMGLYVDLRQKEPQYFLPQGSAPSSHIVKASNRHFEQLSENEYFCLQLAKAAGLEVPDSFVDVIDGNPLFVIERFDRKKVARRSEGDNDAFPCILRCHQEDFCQILGLLPEQKYADANSSYVKRVGEKIVEFSFDPVRDLQTFAKLLIFNTVIGNCDGHLKNITAVRGSDWRTFRLSPVYDTASTVIYNGLDRHMAFRIGTTNKIDTVELKDFLLLAEELSLSKNTMKRLINEVCEGVYQATSNIIVAMEYTLNSSLGKLWEIEEFSRQQIGRLAR